MRAAACYIFDGGIAERGGGIQGIDPKYQPKILDKIYQVPSADTSNTDTGLGLAISKEFIEAQGGTIGLVSEVGMGEYVYVYFAGRVVRVI